MATSKKVRITQDRRAQSADGFNNIFRTPPRATNRSANRTEDVIDAIREAIQSIPRGKVASYGEVAAAAGYPRHVRMVPRVLNLHGDGLPWHRVTGAGGEIKIPTEAAREQRLRLEAEGVRFVSNKPGARVDLDSHRHTFLT